LTRKVPCVMAIAGSDSGGGAGVAADLKTFSALGVFGTCVITAITAQNTQGVYEIFPTPPEVVERQIEVVLEDIGVDAVKTGMLHSRETMNVVSNAIRKHDLKAVVDPVLKAGTGSSLVKEGDLAGLIDLMIPCAAVLTPNKQEAEMISGVQIENVDDMKKAAEKISNLGAKAVVVKGGHLKASNVYDVLYCDGDFRTFEKPRIEVEPHGGGCVFSSAIAALLALGQDVLEAVDKAEIFIEESLRNALRVGHGRSPANPSAHLYNEAERFDVIRNVVAAAEMIENNSGFLPWIAEVGTQVGMAVSHAVNRDDVAAVEGRIVKFRRAARPAGCVKFGVSSHIANMILAVMKYNAEARAALNLHYDQRLVEAFRKAGFTISSFDRSVEPEDVKQVEGGTLAWGIEEAIRRVGRVPDAIYDLGEMGKEPMIRILGTSATDAAKKALEALRRL
ncbi:MAG: bifunctional hydroxymethylpyrimidine kinase/phosphomethylpyrimidine kinase, partial [Candidatus Bathyarchaeota archaeon]|nr:bifunctional hydroxymethylpyrimidine kinase/phosphomethylpyrimidine kinase [Candidatus Bathyarchaeota archaeon]